MTFEQIHDHLRLHPHSFGYALDYTGWYLYILDRSDSDWPEPLAYDLQLNEYRDSAAIPERARGQKGWWLSEVKPADAISKWMAVGTPEIANMLAEWHGKPEEPRSCPHAELVQAAVAQLNSLEKKP